MLGFPPPYTLIPWYLLTQLILHNLGQGSFNSILLLPTALKIYIPFYQQQLFSPNANDSQIRLRYIVVQKLNSGLAWTE